MRTRRPYGIAMNHLLRVCVYNLDPEASQELGEAIGSLNFVRLVGEATSPEELADALHDGKINLVFFNLDPDPEPVLEIIEQVAARYPDVALLAIGSRTDPESILAPMRAGCDQFVCRPIDLSDLGTAVSRVAAKRFAVQHKSRVICVSGVSGGMGATSIACNLAMEIGLATDRPCALVDLDLQFGAVASNFDAEPKYTIYDLAVAGADLDEAVLESALCELPCKVSVLARPFDVEHAATVTPESLYRIFELLMQTFENIVVDVPRDINPNATTAFTHADTILLVTQLMVPSIRNAKRYRDALANLGVPDDRIAFIINRCGGRGHGRVTVKDFEETIGRPPFGTIPNDYQFVARSIDFGRPIAALDQNSPVRVAIQKIAKRLITDDHSEPQEEKGGLLRRLLSK